VIKVQRYGWRPSLPDFRDLKFLPPSGASLPDVVDLRGYDLLPEVWDQGELGSCTSHAILAAFQYEQRRQGLPAFNASRLGHYYMERAYEGTPLEDAGAMIRDGIKIVLADGVFPEADWPYDISRFAERPPQACYAAAVKHTAVRYQGLAQDGSSYHLRHAMASGFPVIVGFTVYESFESNAVASTGNVPMPHRGERVLGGHAVLVVGYDMRKLPGHFIVRNSWGSGWGDKGHFFMPVEYLCNDRLSDDFWMINTVR
jgi:C1A family cysteine protease